MRNDEATTPLNLATYLHAAITHARSLCVCEAMVTVTLAPFIISRARLLSQVVITLSPFLATHRALNSLAVLVCSPVPLPFVSVTFNHDTAINPESKNDRERERERARIRTETRRHRRHNTLPVILPLSVPPCPFPVSPCLTAVAIRTPSGAFTAVPSASIIAVASSRWFSSW